MPLHELQPKTDAAKKTLQVHFSLAALVKDTKGEVVQKLSRDRSFQVTPFGQQAKRAVRMEGSQPVASLRPGHNRVALLGSPAR